VSWLVFGLRLGNPRARPRPGCQDGSSPNDELSVRTDQQCLIEAGRLLLLKGLEPLETSAQVGRPRHGQKPVP